MSEKRLWAYLRKGMQSLPIALQRHEDRFSKDIADVSFCVGDRNGWLELKHAKKAPAQKDKPIKFGHPITLGQCLWLNRRHHCFILCQVGRVYYLLPSDAASMLRDTPTLWLLENYSLCIWRNQVLFKELVNQLTYYEED